jgi:protoheme IX farnesyltransferase
MSMETSESKGSVVRAYVKMTKPRIIELLLVTTIPAMVVAADGWPGLGLILVTLLGGTLAAGGANVINQVYDADIDKLMRRTASRPLPTDRVSPSAATWFGGLLGVAGFLVLTFGANLLAGLLAATAYIYYVVVYTMLLKRSSTQNIVIGGAAGAIPALIGWAAYADSLSLAAWVMFAIIFFWTPPHFWALSLKYEDDYRAASVPMLPVVVGESPTFANIFWYSVVAAGTALMLPAVSDLGWIYSVTAVALGAALLVLANKLRGQRARAMRFFVFTNLFLAGIFLAMMVDRLAHVASVGDAWMWMAAASALVGVGIVGVVLVERGPTMRAEGVSAMRHTLEVGLTVVFAVAIVALGWQMVVG